MGQIGAIERRMFADAIHHGLHHDLFPRFPLACLLPEDVLQADRVLTMPSRAAL